MIAKFSLRSAIADILEVFFIGLTVYVLIMLLVGQFLEVTGRSMNPFIKDKEHIIAEKISIRYKPLERGEVIIFWSPKNSTELLVKRVIGLPGDTVKILDGSVYINSLKLDENYLNSNVITKGSDYLAEGQDYKIEPDYYIVMGDNRSESTDSRTWGPIKKEAVIGRAFVVFLPLENIRFLKNP